MNFRHTYNSHIINYLFNLIVIGYNCKKLHQSYKINIILEHKKNDSRGNIQDLQRNASSTLQKIYVNVCCDMSINHNVEKSYVKNYGLTILLSLKTFQKRLNCSTFSNNKLDSILHDLLINLSMQILGLCWWSTHFYAVWVQPSPSYYRYQFMDLK